MKIEDYLSRLNSESQNIFATTLEYREDLGKAHHISSCLYEFAQLIGDTHEREIIQIVSSQLETATLNTCLGMYRQAFSSLRLALEMGLAAVYFSAYKLDLNEWIEGKADIRWSVINDEENGVLSARYSNAFFKELSISIGSYREKSKRVYRELSEFVHGNNETWAHSGLELNFNPNRLDSYFKKIGEVSEIIIFVLSCRYLKSFSDVTLEELDFIREEMNHIQCIREYFGGPKG